MCGSKSKNARIVAEIEAAIATMERSTPNTAEDDAAVERAVFAELDYFRGDALLAQKRSDAWIAEHGDSNDSFVEYYRALLTEVQAAV